jgi:hypothetical protein
VARNFGLKSRTTPARPKRENELEGRQDMGGKQGGQAGVPKSPPRPRSTGRDEDVVPKRSDVKSKP